jgi:hypothetical protein
LRRQTGFGLGPFIRTLTGRDLVAVRLRQSSTKTLQRQRVDDIICLPVTLQIDRCIHGVSVGSIIAGVCIVGCSVRIRIDARSGVRAR